MKAGCSVADAFSEKIILGLNDASINTSANTAVLCCAPIAPRIYVEFNSLCEREGLKLRERGREEASTGGRKGRLFAERETQIKTICSEFYGQ